MYTQFLDKKINYDGGQLRSHFIFDETGFAGDACVAFIGVCDVSLSHMVDLADKKAHCKIFSQKMLHFIIEHFDHDIEKAVLRQRLFVSTAERVIREHAGKKAPDLVRLGNDLFDGTAKINVSIATASKVSALIHVGINILSDGTPVKTKGLNDYKIDPKKFAEEVMKLYKEELEGVTVSRCKVRGVD